MVGFTRRSLMALLVACALVLGAGVVEAKPQKDREPRDRDDDDRQDHDAKAKKEFAAAQSKLAEKESRKSAREDTRRDDRDDKRDEKESGNEDAPIPSQPEPAPPSAATVAAETTSVVPTFTNFAVVSTVPHWLPSPEAVRSMASGTTSPPPDTRLPPIPTPSWSEDGASAGGGAQVGVAATWAPTTDAKATPEGEPSAWWLKLLWAVPFLGVGGLGFVLLLRRKNGLPMPGPSAPRPLMMPAAPDDLRAMLRNGQAAVARGAVDEAVIWFDQALRVEPRLAVALFCKGACLASIGRHADAYDALDQACAARPDDANYRVQFARVAVALGKNKEAMDALERVARMMPDLGSAMMSDPQLAGLRDHPRFLMICGAL